MSAQDERGGGVMNRQEYESRQQRLNQTFGAAESKAAKRGSLSHVWKRLADQTWEAMRDLESEWEGELRDRAEQRRVDAYIDRLRGA